MHPDPHQRLVAVMLSLLVVFVGGVVLLQLQSILLPLVIAILFSNIFEPVVVALKRYHIPTAVSLLLIIFTFAFVLFLIALVVYSSAETLARQLPVYEQRLQSLLQDAITALSGLAAMARIDVKELDWSSAIQLSSLTGALTSGIGSFIDFLSTLFLILLFMLFILAGSGELEQKIRSAFPDRRAAQITEVLDTIEKRVRQYLLTKTLVSASAALLTLGILLIFGIDFALIWAVLAFLLNFIPNIGSAIAVLLPFLLSVLQFGFGGKSLLLLLLLGGTHMTIGNVIEPKLMASRLNLSTVFVLSSLIFWGWLWGIWGMILAIPIMASVKIVLESIDSLRPFALLMGRAPSAKKPT